MLLLIVNILLKNIQVFIYKLSFLKVFKIMLGADKFYEEFWNSLLSIYFSFYLICNIRTVYKGEKSTKIMKTVIRILFYPMKL